ncbi:MAG: hypothetical protein IJ042_04545, partial [Butyricicoccus sp.]|nr:hypothetical protein [Butyricicoccus sp.]
RRRLSFSGEPQLVEKVFSPSCTRISQLRKVVKSYDLIRKTTLTVFFRTNFPFALILSEVF